MNKSKHLIIRSSLSVCNVNKQAPLSACLAVTGPISARSLEVGPKVPSCFVLQHPSPQLCWGLTYVRLQVHFQSPCEHSSFSFRYSLALLYLYAYIIRGLGIALQWELGEQVSMHLPYFRQCQINLRFKSVPQLPQHIIIFFTHQINIERVDSFFLLCNRKDSKFRPYVSHILGQYLRRCPLWRVRILAKQRKSKKLRRNLVSDLIYTCKPLYQAT